jgi:flotillin
MFGWNVPAPDEAMFISGGKNRADTPFRVVTGHGAFALPFFRKVRFLTLSMVETEVEERCVTGQGITLNVRAMIAFKVGDDPESIVNAGQRFLSDQGQMSVLTGRIVARHLRSIIGSMTVEEIVTQRQRLATEVLDGSKEEMAKIGLAVDALQIQSIRRRRPWGYRRDVGVAYGGDPASGADCAGAARQAAEAEQRMLIDQLPQIVHESAGGLEGANVNILNGADGILELAASLVGQARRSSNRCPRISATPLAADTPAANGVARLLNSGVTS